MKKFEDLTFSDDYMFQLVMGNKELCKPFLESLLKISIKDLEYVEREKVIDGKYDLKGARLDLYIEDDEGNSYDIEMQMHNTGYEELFRRSRFYVSVLGTDKLIAGEKHKQMKNVCVIFISPFDMFGENRRVYTFRYICEEDKKIALRDGSTIVYLNSKGFGDVISPIVEDVLNMVEQKPVVSEYGRKLAKEYEWQKANQKGREDYMALTNMVRNVEIESFAKGVDKGKIDAAIGMLKDNMPLNLIMKYTGLSLEKIQELASSIRE